MQTTRETSGNVKCKNGRQTEFFYDCTQIIFETSLSLAQLHISNTQSSETSVTVANYWLKFIANYHSFTCFEKQKKKKKEKNGTGDSSSKIDSPKNWINSNNGKFEIK